MYGLHDIYGADIPRKIALSHVFHECFLSRLNAHSRELGSLTKLTALAEELRRVMSVMQIFSLCRVCGGQPRGGCCSAEMANENDAVLLLMNLLAGCTVTMQREDGFECCFLGANGCVLLFKPMFCLNYNCTKIKERATRSELQQLEQATGQLLQEQYHLEKLLHENLRRAHLLG